MSHIEIIKGVPLPPRSRSGGRKNIYPWDKLEVSDHFVFPKGVKKETAASLAYRAGRVSNKAFAIRVEGDVIKCWRVEKPEEDESAKAQRAARREARKAAKKAEAAGVPAE